MIGLSLPDGPLEVLCLGAHPDDIEIGCGGTLLSLAGTHAMRVVAVVMTALTRASRRSYRIRGRVPARCGCRRAIRAKFPDGRLPADWEGVKLLMQIRSKHSPTADIRASYRRRPSRSPTDR